MIRNDEISLVSLPADRKHSDQWTPGELVRDAMAAELGILALKKLTAHVTLTPLSGGAWHLDARWGATVVQSCVVTLAPVKTRIDGHDTVTFTRTVPEITAAESEMPEDATLEPLVPLIALPRVIGEMIALSLPLYPRVPDVAFENATFAAPGITPMSDHEAKPMAGLAALRERLAREQGSDNT